MDTAPTISAAVICCGTVAHAPISQTKGWSVALRGRRKPARGG